MKMNNKFVPFELHYVRKCDINDTNLLFFKKNACQKQSLLYIITLGI
jgi:hypothetical protein